MDDALYRLLVEEVRDYGIFMLDAEGRFLSWNKGAELILGFSREDVLGRPGALIFTPEDVDRSAPEHEMATAVASGCADDDRWHMRKDGARVWCNGVMTALRDETGNLVGFSKVLRDRTERKELDEEIRGNKERLELALAAARMGTWEWDVCTAAVRWSGIFERICGLVPGTFDGTYDHFIRCVHPEDRTFVEQALAKALTEDRDHTFEFRVVHPDGCVRWVEAKGRAVRDEQGDPTHVLGTGVDVTERKVAEHEIAASRQALRALATRLLSVQEEERARIAREIHDELGQTLTALKIEVGRLGRKPPDDPEKLSARIREIVDFIDATIEQVQRVSTELRPGALDDLGLVAAVEEFVHQFERRTDVACELAIRPSDLALDAQRSTTVFRILQEALTNVARHAGATKVEIALERAGDGVTVAVRDNGRGIRPEEATAPGSLGLVGIYERALVWGGTARIEAAPEGGTVVTAEIPLRGPSPEAG